MSRFNTGNPIGSSSPLDRDDNTKNLDVAVNDPNVDTWPDRFGVLRWTWSGMERAFDLAQDVRDSLFRTEQEGRIASFIDEQSDREQRFSEFIAASGYTGTGPNGEIVDYSADIVVTEYNQLIRDENGEFWRVSGAVDLPYTTDGSGLPEGGALVSVGDAALRQELIIGSPAFASQTGIQGLPEALDSRVPTVRTSSGGVVAASVTLQEGDIRKNHGVTYVPSGVDVVAIDGVWIC